MAKYLEASEKITIFAAVNYSMTPSINMQNIKLEEVSTIGTSVIYQIQNCGVSNRYYVVSSPESIDLLARPEVVGYNCQRCLLPSTQSFLQYLCDHEGIYRPHILNILRGGLNFPLEEASYNIGINVCNTDFVTCERVIEQGQIKGLDIKYEKIIAEEGATLLIGDIIASGETLCECLPLICRRYRDMGGSIRRVVFFTIGGTKAVSIMERMSAKIKELWPDFEGFCCIFYEGMFSVYEDQGVTGINTPAIDFYWNDGVVAPEFRRSVVQMPYALLEKCIIYDGGARRYEMLNHIEEVLEYWHALLEVADQVDYQALVEEKLGYPLSCTYDAWLQATALQPSAVHEALYQCELIYARKLLQQGTLRSLCEQRITDFQTAMTSYMNE